MSLNTKQKIDAFIKDFKENKENVDLKKYKNLYNLGKVLESKLEKEIVEIRENRYKYVTWKWYEYILRNIDADHFFWVSYADEFRVEVTIQWLGKEYKGSYGIDEISISSKTGKPNNTISEKTINEGMRCYAKIASRVTGLFLHLWYEGVNK